MQERGGLLICTLRYQAIYSVMNRNPIIIWLLTLQELGRAAAAPKRNIPIYSCVLLPSYKCLVCTYGYHVCHFLSVITERYYTVTQNSTSTIMEWAVISLAYPMTSFHVNISSMFNKVPDCFNSSLINCHRQWSELMEKNMKVQFFTAISNI